MYRPLLSVGRITKLFRAGPGTFAHNCGWLLAIGLLVRLLVAPLTSTSEDIYTWWTTATNAYFGVHLYQQPGFSYPPLWGYVLEFLGSAARWAGLPSNALGVPVSGLSALHSQLGDIATGVTSPLFNVLMKSVLFFFDALTGVLIWRAVQRFGAPLARARWAFGSWFLGPAVLFESAVHGAFDVFIAFFTLLALTARMERRFILCGLALAFGVGAKLAPLFLVPLFAATILAPFPEESAAERLRSLGRFALGGLLGAAVVVGPIGLVKEVPQLVDTVLAASAGPPSSGGLSAFGAEYVPWFGSLAGWLAGPGHWYATAVPWLDLGVALALPLAYVRWGRPHGSAGLLSLACLAYLVVYIATPLVQPQYLIWVLPLLLVGATVVPSARIRRGVYFLQAAVVTFELGVLGPLALVTPASYYFGVPRLNVVVSRTLAFVTLPGFFASSLSYDFLAAAWILAAVGYVVLVFALCRGDLWSTVRRPGAEPPQARRSGQTSRDIQRARRSKVVVASGWSVIGVLILSAAWSVGPLYAAGSNHLSVTNLTHSGMAVTARFDASIHDGPARVVGFPVTTRPRVPSIYFYDGAGYPAAGSSAASVQGVFNHLTADLGPGHPIALVSAASLPAFLRDRAAATGRALVVSSGTLPATVWPASGQLVTSWIASGGLFIWAGGAPPGYYVVRRGASMFSRPAVAPQGLLCGFPSVAPPLARAVTVLGQQGVDAIVGHRNFLNAGSACWSFSGPAPSRAAASLGLPYSLIHAGPSLPTLRSVGGAALGYIGAGSTSIAFWPIGHGHFLLFTGETLATPIANSLSRILISGVLFATGPLVSVLLSPGEHRHSSLRIRTSHSARFLVVVALGVPVGDPLLLHTLADLSRA